MQNPSHTYTSLGNHTVSLTVSNNGQHNSTKANYITIDTIYATITSTPASLTDATTAGFGFSATRSDATFLCQLDTGTFLPCTNPWSYSSLSAGSHRFTVEAVGSTGYIFPSVSYSWTIDLTPPHTTITQPYPTGSMSGEFFFVSSKSGSQFQCNMDNGGFSSCSSPYAFNRSNGTHVFEVEAIDEAGNVDPNPATYSWTIFPATELGSCPYKITASNVATFEFSPVGTAGLSCQCKLDSGSFQSCVSPDSFINLADGSHTFTVRAIDQNGVVDPSPPSYTWTIKTWSSIGISGANVQTVIAASTNPTTIYAGTAQNGVYESTDGGTTWTAINSGLTSNDIMTLAADPVSPAVIYAGTLGGGVFKSVNGGSAWSAANSGLPANSTVYALAIPQQFHQTVYAGLNSGAYKSVNSGSSWSSVSTGLPANTSVRSLSILSTNANVVYAGTDGGGVFETTNGGANWSAENAGLTNLSIYAIALDPQNSQNLYAGTSSGQIFKSLDGGQSWNLINSGLPDAITSFSFEPNNTSIVYAGTLGAGVYESTDGGSTWNLSIGANSNTTWESMVVDTSRQEIISSVGGGVYYRAEIRVPVPALPPFALTVGLVILGTLGWRRVLKRKTDSNES